MRHVPEGTLRRMVDEPLAVADADVRHTQACSRCARRRDVAAADADLASALFARPVALPDVEAAWSRHLDAVSAPATSVAKVKPATVRAWRPIVVSVPSPALILASIAIVAAAVTAVVVTKTPAGSPADTSPTVPAGFISLADITGVASGPGTLGGLHTPNGFMKLSFGDLSWSSAGPSKVASIAAAERVTGLHVPDPSRLPQGVGRPQTVVVQSEVRATIRFSSATGVSPAGSELTIDAGPAVLVEYGGDSDGVELPTLATFVMARPSVSATSGSALRLEAYVLSQPELPAGLAQELRLLGNLSVLPVSVPPSAEMSQVDISGSPGILVTDPAVGASGVIWIDGEGEIHAALGLLDKKDILDVASELG